MIRAVRQSLPAGLREAQPCQYCFYSVVQKWVFRPTGATHCPDNREICTQVCSPVPNFTFIEATCSNHVVTISPLWGEKPIFGPLSKNNTSMAERCAGLPVMRQIML